MSGDGADSQLRQQHQDTVERNRTARVEQLRQGEVERAQLAAYYAHRRQLQINDRG